MLSSIPTLNYELPRSKLFSRWWHQPPFMEPQFWIQGQTDIRHEFNEFGISLTFFKTNEKRKNTNLHVVYARGEVRDSKLMYGNGSESNLRSFYLYKSLRPIKLRKFYALFQQACVDVW